MANRKKGEQRAADQLFSQVVELFHGFKKAVLEDKEPIPPDLEPTLRQMYQDLLEHEKKTQLAAKTDMDADLSSDRSQGTQHLSPRRQRFLDRIEGLKKDIKKDERRMKMEIRIAEMQGSKGKKRSKKRDIARRKRKFRGLGDKDQWKSL